MAAPVAPFVGWARRREGRRWDKWEPYCTGVMPSECWDYFANHFMDDDENWGCVVMDQGQDPNKPPRKPKT